MDNFDQNDHRGAVAIMVVQGKVAEFSVMEDDEDKGERHPRKQNKDRGLDTATKQVKRFYFATLSVYKESGFETRFRMPKAISNRIEATLQGKGELNVSSKGVLGKPGASHLIKITAALRILSYSTSCWSGGQALRARILDDAKHVSQFLKWTDNIIMQQAPAKSENRRPENDPSYQRIERSSWCDRMVGLSTLVLEELPGGMGWTLEKKGEYSHSFVEENCRSEIILMMISFWYPRIHERFQFSGLLYTCRETRTRTSVTEI